MDQAVVPIVLIAVALVVGWVTYDQRYGFRRHVAAMRRKQGDAAADAVVEAARHLIADGWSEPQAYAKALETRMKVASFQVKVETDRRMRASSQKAAEAHGEQEKQRTDAKLRVLAKHSEGMIPGQGPAKKQPTPPPDPRLKKAK